VGRVRIFLQLFLTSAFQVPTLTTFHAHCRVTYLCNVFFSSAFYARQMIYTLKSVFKSASQSFTQGLFELTKFCDTLLSVSCQVSAKFGTCTVVSLNGTLVVAKMFTLTLECTHFIFNKCPI
jgi:hypothetical protein